MEMLCRFGCQRIQFAIEAAACREWKTGLMLAASHRAGHGPVWLASQLFPQNRALLPKYQCKMEKAVHRLAFVRLLRTELIEVVENTGAAAGGAKGTRALTKCLHG